MNRKSKVVKASRFYSRRINKLALKDIKYYTSKNTPDIYDVGDNLKQAVNNFKTQNNENYNSDYDGQKDLSGKIKGTYYTGVAEIYTGKKTVEISKDIVLLPERTAEEVKEIQYAIEKHKDKKEAYREYYYAKKKLARLKKLEKQSENEVKNKSKSDNHHKMQEDSKVNSESKATYDNKNYPESKAGTKVPAKGKNKNGELTKLKKENRELRKKINRRNIKSLRTKRYTKAVKNIKYSAIKGVNSEVKKFTNLPSKATMMLNDDLDMEKMTQKLATKTSTYFVSLIKNIMALMFEAAKSILLMLLPSTLFILFLFFFIYIIFFTDFESYFNISSEDIGGSSVNTESIITDYFYIKRDEYAQTMLANNSELQIYFVKFEDGFFEEIILYMKEKSKEANIPSIIYSDWLDSEEAKAIMDGITLDMFYRMPNEAVGSFTDDQLEAYAGNAVESESSYRVVIGYYDAELP